MFESAEIGHRVEKERWKQESARLRHALLQAQYRLLNEGRTAVLILVDRKSVV